ncbi:MAG TPA: MoaD/ThiS family protein [Clostridia bacterium]|jgi:MoaD family protein|nr:MoaD/ThiS family protein [Clostridia bacterium]
MIKVEFFGLYRLSYKMKEWTTDASTVEEVIEKLAAEYPVYSVKELKNSVIMVNGTNFLKLRKFKTELKDGDTVFVMSPASGG